VQFQEFIADLEMLVDRDRGRVRHWKQPCAQKRCFRAIENMWFATEKW
jgi:hypothetical protein